MKLALAVDYGFDEQLILAQQLGADAVVVSLREWRAELLAGARNRVVKSGLELAAIRLPDVGPEDLDALAAMVGAAGAASVGMLSCGLAMPGEGPVGPEPAGRGGALVRSYAGPAVGDGETRSEVVIRALDDLHPAATEAGVRLAWRPGMPPAPYLEELRRQLEGDQYPSMGLDLALGSLTRSDYLADLEGVQASGRLWLVELTNVEGEDHLRDAFLDEGHIDLPRALRLLRREGYSGLVRAGPPPGMQGDAGWGHRGRAHDLGFLRAILQAVEARPGEPAADPTEQSSPAPVAG